MSQPSIIGSTTNNKVYETTDSGTSRSYSVAVPAEANTIAVMCGLDAIATSGGITTGAITVSGITGASVILDTDASMVTSSGSDTRLARLGVIDVRSCGAGTLTVACALTGGSATAKSLLAVVCTDGYLESASLFVDRFMEKAHIATHSGNNNNNALVCMGILDKEGLVFSGTGVSQLFNTTHSAGSSSLSGVAATQFTTGSDLMKRIVMDEPSGGGEEFTGVGLLFSTQPNAFGDIDPRGDIISHDIITN